MSDFGSNIGDSFPLAGAVFAGGIASVVRIPVPGPDNLAIELSPRNFQGKSTSTLFIQDATGKKCLRLDYGYNVKTKMVDYHWNQKGAYDAFNITNHTPAGSIGEGLYKSARAFKYLGRGLVVVGAGIDLISIIRANKPVKRATEVVSAWGMAYVGAASVGLLGAELGALGGPPGIAIGGLVFGFVGGVAGYYTGEKVGGVVYDWATDTVFEYLQEVPAKAAPGLGVGPAAYQNGGPGLPVYSRPSRMGGK